MSQITGNIRCFEAFLKEIPEWKSKWENSECMQRCDYYTYNTELSITKWVPSSEKLFRIADLMNKTEAYMKNNTDPKHKQDYLKYVQSDITSSYVNEDPSMNFENENRFTYISLSRKTKNTVIKDEELVLDLAILMSRIGGLCSLFIGLTVSFFIELIEFGYLIWCNNNFVEKSAKSFNDVNRKNCQICESNNSLYDIPSMNRYDKESDQNNGENFDYKRGLEFVDDSHLRKPVGGQDNFIQTQFGFQNN